jgi:LEA14-like dessication related protein
MRDPLPRRFAPIVTLSLVALAACGGPREPREPAPTVPFTQPDVALRNVQLRGVGLTKTALDLDLRVTNANEYALEAPRVSYRVFVGDVELAKGEADLDVVVATGDSALVRVPASVGYLSLQRAGLEVLGAGAANYRVRGRITVGTPYGRMSFPYDRIGRFSPIPR